MHCAFMFLGFLHEIPLLPLTSLACVMLVSGSAVECEFTEERQL